MNTWSSLVLVLVLAGCSFPSLEPPREEEEDPIERPGDLEGSGPLCGRVAIEAPATARAGEPLEITASLANCGDRTLQVDRGLCPDEGAGFRTSLRRGVNDWHLHARDVPDAAALRDAPCVRGGSSIFGLPPAQGDLDIAHVVTFRWNGTFATDPCWPPGPDGLACLQFARAAPGEYELRARIAASGVLWESDATLVLEGDAPAAAEPCGRVRLAREDALLELTIENCGATDLTLDPALACNEGYPVRLVVEGENGTRRWGGDAGCEPLVPERVVPPGGHAWARFGALRMEGDRAIVATVRALEGWEGEARAAFAAP